MTETKAWIAVILGTALAALLLFGLATGHYTQGPQDLPARAEYTVTTTTRAPRQLTPEQHDDRRLELREQQRDRDDR